MSLNKIKEHESKIISYKERLRTFRVLLTFTTIGFISTISVVVYLVYKLFKYIF